jgi:hypothetical protein
MAAIQFQWVEVGEREAWLLPSHAGCGSGDADPRAGEAHCVIGPRAEFTTTIDDECRHCHEAPPAQPRLP